jgi:hypothetical protein
LWITKVGAWTKTEEDRLAECRALPAGSAPFALRSEREAGRQQQDEEDEACEGGGQSFAYALWALALL